MKSITELRKGLMCLVPKESAVNAHSTLLSCHEYSVCDCTVLALLDDWERMEEVLREVMVRISKREPQDLVGILSCLASLKLEKGVPK